MTIFHNYLFLIVFICVSFLSKANTINVAWDVKSFFEPEKKFSYLDVYFSIPSNIVEYKTVASGKIQSSVIVSIEIFRNDSTIAEKAFRLKSPEYASVFDNIIDLEDLVRMPVTNDDSLIVFFKINDSNNPKNFFSDTKKIFVSKPDTAFISDIMFVQQMLPGEETNPFFRNGLNIIPKNYPFFSAAESKLNFYVEFYQPETKGSFLLRYLIADDNSVLMNEFAGFKKLSAKNFDATLASLDISKLPSGNYNFFVELRDSENKLVGRKKMYFQRSNKVESTDFRDFSELDVITKNFARKYDLKNIIHHTKALAPIASDFEKAAIEGLVAAGNLEDLQNYFFTFWKKRDAINAEALWKSYAEKLQFVEQKFSTSTERGYQTERGVVYLKYGAPTERVERPNSQMGQYEVWYYEQLKNQATVYFVFVNQNRITEEFFLVHSNLIGEVFSKVWAERIRTGNF